MATLLIIIMLAPFAGFLVLSLAGRRLTRPVAGMIGTGSVAVPALLTIVLGIRYLVEDPGPVTIQLWQWLSVAGLKPDIALYLDPLSLVFIFVITFVGALIHLYSLEYMQGDRNFSLFFAYMNLFVGSMLLLVLADNFIFLYLGWEGVGLCSFLLIGFWYTESKNNAAARKAFIVTRIGDVALVIGLFLLFFQFHSLNIREIMEGIPGRWMAGSPVANAVAILFLAGAAGKSAQLPLQTWLPDAMAGPTPVSALIHSATMVTAGVYLIARSHVIYLFSPAGSMAVAVIGAATLLIAGLSAMVQSDIKKVLAYSTISQIGYMFLGLGVGAWTAAIFHFMVHAFFKSLLFLGAGVLILAMDHERNMFMMGGLRKKLPLTFVTFLAGSFSLSALPLVSAGFYSKEQILSGALEGTYGSLGLWIVGMTGVLITAVYTFRMVFITFYGGPVQSGISHFPGAATKVVLLILAFLAITAGFLDLPHYMARSGMFSGFLASLFPMQAAESHGGPPETLLALASSILTCSGIFIAYLAFRRDSFRRLRRSVVFHWTRTFLFNGFGFDYVYHHLFVRPMLALARINRRDFIDSIYTGCSSVFLWLNKQLAVTQSGKISWYLMGIVFGTILVLTIILTL
jgi:NADH-quinone oxidoreductase subunit L